VREIQLQQIGHSDFVQNYLKVASVDVSLSERKRVDFFFDLADKHLSVVGSFRRGDVISVMETVCKLNHGHKEYKCFNFLLRSCDKEVGINQNYRIFIFHYLR